MRIVAALVLAGALASGALAAAGSPTTVARIRVAAGTAPCAAAAGGGAVWVSEYGAPYLLEIDPGTNRVVRRARIGFGSCGLGYGAGSLWVEDTSSGTVSRGSTRTGRRIRAIPVGSLPYDTTFAYGSAWTTSHGGGELERIDPARNAVVRRWKLPMAVGVVAAFGSIWATGYDGVVRIDPQTNAVAARISLPGASWTASSAGAVWITAGSGVVPVDPDTNTAGTPIPLGTSALGDPDVVAGRLWVPKIAANAIAIVDPAAGTVVQTLKVGTGPFVVTQIAGQAWVPSWKGADVWRIAP